MSNFKAPLLLSASDPVDIGAKVTEVLMTSEVRAIVLDTRQKLLIVHFEDGSPKKIGITQDSVPYLLTQHKIDILNGEPTLEKAVAALHVRAMGKDKALLCSAKTAEKLSSPIPVITSRLLGDGILVLVAGPPDLDSLDQVTLHAVSVENI